MLSKSLSLSLSLALSALHRRRKQQNAVTAVGHAVSWLFEMLLIAMIMFFAYGQPMHAEAAVQIYLFLFPCTNLVVFPLVQLVTSGTLMREIKASLLAV